MTFNENLLSSYNPIHSVYLSERTFMSLISVLNSAIFWSPTLVRLYDMLVRRDQQKNFP